VLAQKRVVDKDKKIASRKVNKKAKKKDPPKYTTTRRRAARKITTPHQITESNPRGGGAMTLQESDLPIGKKQMIALIKQCFGLVKYIAAACRVSRSTIYNWRDTFPWFAEAMGDWKEDLVDLSVHSLVKNVRKGKEYSTTYSLNCLGRDRGFINTQVIQHQDNRPFEEMKDEQLDKRTAEESDRLALLNDGTTTS